MTDVRAISQLSCDKAILVVRRAGMGGNPATGACQRRLESSVLSGAVQVLSRMKVLAHCGDVVSS
jgi:hypothetical protein